MKAVRQAHLAFAEAVAAMSSLDPMTVELVRRRCARTHDCRVCQSIRYDSALQAGVDESALAKVDHYEDSDFEERTKVALRITDAIIRRPGEMSEGLIAHARMHFSDEELIELCLHIAKNSTQKIGVALGTDMNTHPADERGLTFVSSSSSVSKATYAARPASTTAN